MTTVITLIEYRIEHEALKALPNRQRNQLVGCMHAHNELSFLNRLLMFASTDFGEGPIHDDAHSVQVWTSIQLLVGKLYETWAMITERFLACTPEDPAISALDPAHKECLMWLREHFGPDLKGSLLRTIRDRSAFHYDKLNLADAIQNLQERDNVVYLAQHPVNTNYFLGSALIFRTIFSMLATVAGVDLALPALEREQQGVDRALEQIGTVNSKLTKVLYGLIKYLLSEAAGGDLDVTDHARSEVVGAPEPEKVALPAFVDWPTPAKAE